MTDPTARLLTRTRRRLTIVTLGLVALLVVGIGAATALVTLRALDVNVDQRPRLERRCCRSRAPRWPAGRRRALCRQRGRDPGGIGHVHPGPRAGWAPRLEPVTRQPPGPSRRGRRRRRPSRWPRPANDGCGRHRRPPADGPGQRREGGARIGYVQGGFVLTLHDLQSQSIVAAILLVGAIGLIGAAIVTLIVTGRALVPIRRTFDAQRRFVADASHELRTPAALIRANADVMEREDLVTDDGRPFVADIITEADRLARLVGDMLQLAATDAAQIVIDPQPVDLGAIATETVRQAVALATERAVHLVMAPGALPSVVVNGDRDRLIQLILILLDNAFDHSPPGGTVTLDLRIADRDVELSVADEGPGVPASDRERVFEPFTRLPGVPRDRAGGTGLGLAIGRRIATAHGGTVVVTVSPGGGAAFRVTIPAAGAVPQ